MYIDFEPLGRRGPCPSGSTLLDCARRLGVDLANLCGGVGSCGRCKVQILSGELSELTGSDEDQLTADELAQGFRLACQAIPLSDCKVRVPEESLSAPQRTQIEGQEVQVAPEPSVHLYQVQVPQPSLDDLRADAERLVAALEEQWGVAVTSFDLAALRALSTALRERNWEVNVAVREGEIIACPPSPAGSLQLGLAVDLGTTKIAVYLMNLATGETLASRGIMNPQIAYGEDVIARISYAVQSPAHAVRLQELVAQAIDQAVGELCAQAGAPREQVLDAVVVGNTAMHHLFLRLSVEQLALAPYVPASRSPLDVKAREVGLCLAPGAGIHLLPNIAGYVGADHVAMLLATGIEHMDGVVLALDIGTNTEVCLANRGRLTSLSCASGPAFEGAHIRHGMRAANGAIERLRLAEDRIELQTIGDEPPIGLCGSGILDTLAQLRLAGVVDRSGRMQKDPRVRESDGVREFVIVPEAEQPEGRPAITFTQKDVRELQLAKGAMRTGIEVLLEENNLAEEQIDQVIIAGAFGTYVDVRSAIEVGMLPPLPLDRFHQVGNAAGMGAKLALISASKRLEAQALALRVSYVELATAPRFARVFAESMLLGRDLFR